MKSSGWMSSQSARLERVVRRALARIPEAPLFVVGNQKSGTSAIAGLLGLATGLPACIDLARANRRRTYPRLHHGEITLDRFIAMNRESFAHPIVKEPNLTPFLAVLLERFPRSRAVFVVRDPRDNIRSILQRLGLRGDAPDVPAELVASTPGSWPLVLDGRWMGIAGDTVIDQLAGRWSALVDVWRSCPDRVDLIRYEDFRSDRQASIEALALHLGLEIRYDVGGDVDRDFQPRGDATVDPREFFGDRNLHRIVARCRGGMGEFGYDPDREMSR